jgi:UDP-glucose 4-epimerase
MKNILITGGTGFIGNHLCNLLCDDNITILTKSSKPSKYKTINKDIKDITSDDLVGIDEVYHLASTVDNYNIQTDPYVDVNTNVIGTIALLEACKQKNIKLVYVSTFFAHGNPETLPATVNDKEHPLGLYGATKLCAEHICNVYRNVYGLDVKIARLTNVYGSGDQYLNNKKSAFVRMIYLALTNQPINLYDGGKVERDFIHVSDVVSALKTIMKRGVPGKTYYVGVGEGKSMKELVDIILEECGGQVEPIQSPIFHKQVGIDDFWCDNNDLLSLGWSSKMNIRDGIRETAEQIKKELRSE